MNKKINCEFNDGNAWCKNKKVKRSLFGLGARMCIEFNDNQCKYKPSSVRPIKPPPPPGVIRKEGDYPLH